MAPQTSSIKKKVHHFSLTTDGSKMDRSSLEVVSIQKALHVSSDLKNHLTSCCISCKLICQHIRYLLTKKSCWCLRCNYYTFNNTTLLYILIRLFIYFL